MTTYNKTLPDTFTFTTIFGDAICTATKNSDEGFLVSWQCSNQATFTLTRSTLEIETSLKNREFTIIEPKKALPTTFKFKHADDEDLIYTATKQPEGDYKITWQSRGLSREIPWLTEELENNIKTGIWNIVEEPLLKCENDANGETANVLFDDAPALSFLNEIIRSKTAAEEHVEEEFPDICLLQYIKEFVEHTGATVAIDCDGYSIVYDGVEYAASCDCELTEVCGAIATLQMAAV